MTRRELKDISEVHGRIVSPDKYREAAARDKTLPKFRGKPANLPPKNGATQKHMYRVFLASLLEKRNRREARAWLKNGGGKTAHLLVRR